MKSLKKQKQSKGFTLTELAVVIAVIAVLIAVLVPTFVSLINKASESAQQQEAKNINTTLSTGSATEGTPTNIGEVIDILVAGGYAEELTTNSSDTEYIWVKEDNTVVLYNFTESKSIYPEDYDLTGKTYSYFTTNSDVYAGFAAGDGSEDSPYEIATLNQLESLRTLISLGTNSTASVKYSTVSKKITSTATTNDYVYIQLDRNLDLGNTWVPLGSTQYVGDFYGDGGYTVAETGFIGTFDGNGHTLTISDSIYSDGDTDFALFANIYSSQNGEATVIENLNVEMNVQSRVYETSVGDGYELRITPYSCSAIAVDVVGDGADSVIFKNITVTGTIKAGAVAAGLVKSAKGCTFENCVNKADITTRSCNDPYSGTGSAGQFWFTMLGGICAEVSSYMNTTTSAYTHLNERDLSVSFENCANYGTLSYKFYCYDYSDVEDNYPDKSYSTWYDYYDSNNSMIKHYIGQIAGTVCTPSGYVNSDTNTCKLSFTNCIANGDIVVYCHSNDDSELNFEGSYYKYSLIEVTGTYDSNGDCTEISDSSGNEYSSDTYEVLDGYLYNCSIWQYVYSVENIATTYTSSANYNKQLIGGGACATTIIDGTTYTFNNEGDTFTNG